MITRAIPAVLVSVALSGCSLFGTDEYSCQGYPEGVQCMSASEVYEKTDHSSQPLSDQGHEGHDHAKDGGSDQASDSFAHRGRVHQPAPNTDQGEKRAAYSDEQRKRGSFVKNEGPTPIRTPAKVMRIWVDTYEDKNGDLHNPGFIYTEIEQRTWNIGHRAPEKAQSITPLKGNR